MKPELSTMFKLKMELYSLRFEVSKNIKSENWSEDDLMQVLKRLKRNKSSDSNGFFLWIISPWCYWQRSILFTVKTQLIIPKFLTFTDITSLYKSRGDNSDLDSRFGIHNRKANSTRQLWDNRWFYEWFQCGRKKKKKHQR